jgi:hypothetical protein
LQTGLAHTPVKDFEHLASLYFLELLIVTHCSALQPPFGSLEGQLGFLEVPVLFMYNELPLIQL